MSFDPTDFECFPHDLRPRVRTEADWFNATDPEPILRHFQGLRRDRTPEGRRRLRLFGVACCRRVWHLIEPYPAISACIEFAERYADGDGAKTRLKKMVVANEEWVERNRLRLGLTLLVGEVAMASRRTCGGEASTAGYAYKMLGRHTGGDPDIDHPSQATLLRCIFGNPFRPVTFDPRWRTETAVALAAGIYESRAFDRLPILADALEEAGCDIPDILAHCRQPDGLHARGCWVVDGVLGKA